MLQNCKVIYNNLQHFKFAAFYTVQILKQTCSIIRALCVARNGRVCVVCPGSLGQLFFSFWPPQIRGTGGVVQHSATMTKTTKTTTMTPAQVDAAGNPVLLTKTPPINYHPLDSDRHHGGKKSKKSLGKAPATGGKKGGKTATHAGKAQIALAKKGKGTGSSKTTSSGTTVRPRDAARKKISEIMQEGALAKVGSAKCFERYAREFMKNFLADENAQRPPKKKPTTGPLAIKEPKEVTRISTGVLAALQDATHSHAMTMLGRAQIIMHTANRKVLLPVHVERAADYIQTKNATIAPAAMYTIFPEAKKAVIEERKKREAKVAGYRKSHTPDKGTYLHGRWYTKQQIDDGDAKRDAEDAAAQRAEEKDEKEKLKKSKAKK